MSSTYRQGRNAFENLTKGAYNGSGTFDIPVLSSEHSKTTDFIGWNYARSCKCPEAKGLHFFVDDYQFSRVWTNPDQYLDLLRHFKTVCTPDFSMYTDFPVAIQIYNHYRKHWLGAYWQQNGITVIPTIGWVDRASFDWCFDGEPVGADVAVSSVGTQASPKSRQLFMDGYNEMLQRLHPERVFFYGRVPDGCSGNIIRLTAFQEQLRKRCDKRRKENN